MDKDDEAPPTHAQSTQPPAGASETGSGPTSPDAPVQGPDFAPGSKVAPGSEVAAGGVPVAEAEEGTLDAFVSGAAYAVLALLGFVVALIGSFCLGWTVGDVPAASIALVVVVFGLVRVAGWGMGGRLGALIPAVVWGLVVFVMSMQRPEGDLVVPATLAGYIYIIGGMVAVVLGVMRVPSARPSGEWLTGRPRG